MSKNKQKATEYLPFVLCAYVWKHAINVICIDCSLMPRSCWGFVDVVLFPSVACLPFRSGAVIAWWNSCAENCVFGGLPCRAFRLVCDPAGETWPNLWFTAVQPGVCANSSLSAVSGTYATLSWACKQIQPPILSIFSPVYCYCTKERSRKAQHHASS